ncbi:MAG: ABC transporter permease [Dietzia sp.]
MSGRGLQTGGAASGARRRGAVSGARRRGVLDAVDELGTALLFVAHALRAAATAPVRQGRETLRVTTEVGLGTGVFAMFGGSLAILGFITLFAGATVAVQGYNSLGDIGVEALTGFLAAYVNIRVVAPVTAGVGLAATIGAGTTAQLGGRPRLGAPDPPPRRRRPHAWRDVHRHRLSRRPADPSAARAVPAGHAGARPRDGRPRTRRVAR